MSFSDKSMKSDATKETVLFTRVISDTSGDKIKNKEFGALRQPKIAGYGIHT